MDYETISILGVLFGIVATILLYVMVLPKSKDGKLANPFLQFLHDFFHFKTLYLEVIMKVIFTLATCIVVFYGFFTLFGETYWGDSTFLEGLLILILGPIVLRIAYEFVMMTILMVQNIIDINKKMPKPGASAEISEPAPQEPVLRFCSNCGTQYDANTTKTCSNCGAELN